MTAVAILVPVLDRPHRIEPLLASIDAATRVPHRVLFCASPNDDAELAELDRCGADVLVMDRPRRPGDYALKINSGLLATTEPVVFTAADDLVFHDGWFEAAAAHLTDGIHVVGTNDLGNQGVMDGNASTHTLVTRAYATTRTGTFDQTGPIYFPGYDHNYCDVELVFTARMRKAWAAARDSFVEHTHPSWGKAKSDHIYDLGRAKFEQDRQLWRSRQRLIRRAIGRLRAGA